MAPKFFIGIDISKLTLDFAVLSGEQVLEHCQIDNTVKAVTATLASLRKKFQCTPANSILCAEQMGPYRNFLVAGALKKKYKICLENPLHLKRSMGIARGKSDKIDAIRIANYAARHHAVLKIWEEPRPVIMQLKMLSSLRKRLLKAKRMFLNNQSMERHFIDKVNQKKLAEICSGSVTSITLDIKKVEKQIAQLVQEDERLRMLYSHITSVPFVGNIIAIELLICTNEFKYFSSPRKFASYCGIAPFTYSSGTSLNAKARISGYANKEMKSLIHIAAVGNLRRKDSKLSMYYERKVKEGKHKFCVLNAMRNKIVHYVFACVNNNRPFTVGYSPGAS